MKRFYMTTPLYYVNDTPHIGHAYTTVVADILTRYHRLYGNETLLLTGTDEHGQKVQKAALAANKDPQKHCDEMAQNFTQIWQELNIDYDIFYRTTATDHKAVVQTCLQELFDKGEIYAKEYEGWYAQSEEVFYTEKDLVDGKSPQGNDVEKITEQNYFFKMSAYQDQLVDYIESHDDFILPKSKKNEVLGFLKKPLNDLCISRPKERLSWGIELPFDKNYVTYVWFDALINYAAAVGLKQDEQQETFKQWWQRPNGAIHLIGKDILMTHAVYWPTMLMALNVDLPKTIFAHGWWLTNNDEKMSKSKGAVVKPLDMKDMVGVDALRYFLIRDIRLGNDAQFSQDLVVTRINTDLANNLGNLLNRVSNLVSKYFDGKMPAMQDLSEEEKHLKNKVLALKAEVKTLIDDMAPDQAVAKIFDVLTLVNQYVDEKAPWKMAKEDVSAAGHVLGFCIETIRVCAILLQPVMPEKMQNLFCRLGVKNTNIDQAEQFSVLNTDVKIEKADPLFPRIDLPKN
ncbi:MAG TPA: methionine--tRNA ligase [Oligoflexia bacterium]|nr:methionine--tRNA ligase [Oligoflexia bacterium]HMR25223.1 methionine--tRNA ligase [Oligoflexia bacterium]